MIISFGDDATEDLYHGRRTKQVRKLPHDILHRTLVRLDVINTAHSLIDLRSPPGNRLEALGGSWAGFHSIRINQQWRIIFRWEDGNAYDVQIIDYH